LIFNVFAKCSTRFADFAEQLELWQNNWSPTSASMLMHAGQFVGGIISLKVYFSQI